MPTSYTFSTFQELFDRVPADRIHACLEELGGMLSKTKTDIILACMTAGIKHEGAFQLGEKLTWIDDGKRDVHLTIVPTVK
jgi:hypothetical protein